MISSAPLLLLIACCLWSLANALPQTTRKVSIVSDTSLSGVSGSTLAHSRDLPASISVLKPQPSMPSFNLNVERLLQYRETLEPETRQYLDEELLQALVVGDIHVALKWLDGGAAPGLTDQGGNSALSYAAYHGFHRLLQILLQYPQAYLVLNAANMDGNIPLTIAIREACEESVRLLLQAGSRLDISNRHSHSPLMTLVSRRSLHPKERQRRLDIAAMLIDAGAKIDAQTYEYAFENGYLEIASYLKHVYEYADA